MDETVRTFAIGDIHGCSIALNRLLESLQLKPQDKLIFLGDYIDRGPDSQGVLNRLIEIQAQRDSIFLRGNHEVILMEYMAGRLDLATWCLAGGQATLDSYHGSMDSMPKAHREFLNQTSLTYETDDYFFVHANYDEALPLDLQVEHVLLWEHLSTRFPGPHASGKKCICGHTPQVSGRVLDSNHLLCIDTYCFGSGWLTAYELSSKTVFQANQKGKIRQGESIWKRVFARKRGAVES